MNPYALLIMAMAGFGAAAVAVSSSSAKDREAEFIRFLKKISPELGYKWFPGVMFGMFKMYANKKGVSITQLVNDELKSVGTRPVNQYKFQVEFMFNNMLKAYAWAQSNLGKQPNLKEVLRELVTSIENKSGASVDATLGQIKSYAKEKGLDFNWTDSVSGIGSYSEYGLEGVFDKAGV